MVGTITPVGHGGSRSRWAVSIGLHALGATVAAAALGAALGGAGRALGAPWGRGGVLLLAGVAGLYAARELLGLPVPLPERRRQVPEWWRTYFSPPAAAFLYGAGLGAGFLTHVRHGTLVAVAAAAGASGDPALGALLVAPFGLARAAGVAVVASGTTSERVSAVVHRLETVARSPAPALANGLVLVAVGLAAAAAVAAPADGPHIAGLTGPAGAALGVSFGWAALAKALRSRGWRSALRAYDLGAWTRPAVVGVPVLEAAVPAVLLAGRAGEAALLAAALLTGFTAALLRARRRAGDRLPCGCFGGTGRRDWRLLVARNAALGFAAALVLAAPPGSGAPRLRAPAPEEALPAALAVIGLVAGAWIAARASAWLGRGR